MTLKMSLSCLSYLVTSLGILTPIQPLFTHSVHILCQLVSKNMKKLGAPSSKDLSQDKKSSHLVSDNYQKFLAYLLQNVNQISYQDFKNRVKTCLPFREQDLRLLNFIFESLAIVSSEDAFNLQIKIDKNRLIGMPDVNEGIIDCVRFEEWEDKVAQMM